MIKNAHTRSRGFVSIEIMFTLIVIAIMTSIGVALESKWSDSQNYQVAAQQQQAVADAASKYLKDNYAAVATAAASAPVQITVPMLRTSGYLSSGFSDTNAFGQTFLITARKAGTNQLESIVITSGGQAIDEIGTREIAENLGGSGGFIPGTNTTVVQGVRGGWQVNLGSFGINPGVGHTASALFLQDGTLANDYLYRNYIAGKSELNRMNTGLDMGTNDVSNATNVTAQGQVQGEKLKSNSRTEVGEYIDIQSEEVEGTACEKTGLVSKTAKGMILSCQSTGTGLFWTATRGGAYGGTFMTSANDGNCAAPNPYTGSCTCPSGFDSGTDQGMISTASGTFYSASCTVKTKSLYSYTVQRHIKLYLSPKAPTTVDTTCYVSTSGCACPGGTVAAAQSATSGYYTTSGAGIIDHRLEYIYYQCRTTST